MKTCPACHRTVPDDAVVCPHAGCGKPLAAPQAATTKKRPPPPGPVRMANVKATQPLSVGPPLPNGRRPSWRGVLSTLALLLLAVVLAGGIYYAAVQQQSTEKPTTTIAQATDEIKKAPSDQPPKSPKKAAGDEAKKDIEPPSTTSSDEPSPKETKVTDDAVPAPAQVVASEPEPLGLYAKRTQKDRETWIGEVGGTAASELGVTEGLDWLARHQDEDGHWGPDCLGPKGSRCDKEHPCEGRGGAYEAAQTGLAVLAFQAGGNYDFNERRYSENVHRGLDWLAARQGPNGEIVGSRNPVVAVSNERQPYDSRYMYEHSIATFALAEACAVARSAQRHVDEKYLAAAIKAVKFIEAQQHDDGGWRYSNFKPEPSDTSISGWAMLALKTANEADLKVERPTMTRMTAFFKRMADPLTGRTHYQNVQYISDATTGVGMMVDEFINRQPDSELVHLAADYLADEAEGRWSNGHNDKPDYYLWYNCTLAMFMAGGEPWKRWNDVVRNHVLSLQLHGTECNRGSWEPNDPWGSEGGRIFSTALAVLTLEVYYRFAREEVEK